MRSSNPVLTSLTQPQRGQQAAYASGMQANPYQGAYQQGGLQHGGYPAAEVADRPMTVDDVVTKTAITLGVIIAGAVLNFYLLLTQPGLAQILTFVGMIGGLITVMVSTFGKKFGSKAVTLTYAAFEGLFVGGISGLLTGVQFSGANATVMIGQAILGTVGVFAGMLWVYKSGAVKVTPKFQRLLLGGIVGVLVMSLGSLLIGMFTGTNLLYDGGPIAIVFSLVCIVLASLSFLSDFDLADRLIRQGAPSQYAWGVALGLAVTLVWLYTEILRLLSYFNRS
ncbi:Bax inhibitor-1/YccA family protein [Corynebacterium gerontici]|uniref:Bax inhibitor 1 like protein n=1 Tax=Corynebacterium gerontici TaxID=2079234 RepID=A0A3G6IZ83_9CORY|nr:Bax inhibitor-1/YccA family protein [Corynebacterium gerontici]AZA11099.1 Bax inhibitor 1 like protein [Corynebacterium gerontici]